MSDVLSIKTTVVKYREKPQAAVQYEIVLSSGTLVYNQNKSDTIQGSLEWQVYRIEGDKRTRMSNNATGMECYCGYSDSPSSTAGVDTTDNVTFDDDGATQRIYKSGETDKFTIIYGEKKNDVFTRLARLDVPVNVTGKDAAVVASIDFDNNNASILYNSITKSYVAGSFPVSNISVIEDGKDISNTAKIYVEVHGLSAQIKGRGFDISLSDGKKTILTTGKGGIISVTVESVESTGYVLAKYIDLAGITHTTRFNVSRSTGRYAAEIITTPTQISYNQTTGVASSNEITATLNVIDIYGNRTTNAPFSSLGAMYWRYVGDSDWTEYEPNSTLGQSATKLKITNINFTKSGVEFRFVDGSGNQLDYETVPFSSVTNGGDAYLVNVASMNVAVVLSSISYGTPTGDVTNVVYMTKNNSVLEEGVRYDVPGDDGEKYTLAANGDKAPDISYNGWHFNYLYLKGRLTSSLVSVDENSPTSVHIPMDVIYPTDNITRTVMISYSAIQKGPAGRSYKPNTPVLYDPKKTYAWTDKYRDFIYYAFTVNEEGEQDDNGVLSYFQYGVKDYGMEGISAPPKYKGGDGNWELVSEYKSIIVNCLFGTNAVLGGLKFTSETMESSTTYDDGTPNIKIDGKKGEVIFNKATIRGEVNATAGTFKNVKITNNCWIEPETQDGDGWFMRGGNDRIAAWWLGYSGKLTGQFTMNTVYDDGSNHPPTASLSFKTPNIQQGGKPDGSTLISAYSNINTPLANFSHAKGMMVGICPSEGIGINFINNAGLATPVAFKGAGHGCLKGVIQGYQLNVITSGQIDISKGNTVYCNGNGTNLILPTRANCGDVLGTTGAFALDLTIIGASGARDFRVYGKRHNSTTGYTTDCYLLNNDHGDDWYATMSQGDVLTLKLIYTGSAFYAYIVSSMQ